MGLVSCRLLPSRLVAQMLSVHSFSVSVLGDDVQAFLLAFALFLLCVVGFAQKYHTTGSVCLYLTRPEVFLLFRVARAVLVDVACVPAFAGGKPLPRWVGLRCPRPSAVFCPDTRLQCVLDVAAGV